jgi:hypothetical protein
MPPPPPPTGQVFCNYFSAIGLAIFMGLHPMVWLLWLCIRLGKTYNQHSGYQLVFCLGAPGPRYHDFHHSHNLGNYGRQELWDVLGGTADAWIAHKLKVWRRCGLGPWAGRRAAEVVPCVCLSPTPHSTPRWTL